MMRDSGQQMLPKIYQLVHCSCAQYGSSLFVASQFLPPPSGTSKPFINVLAVLDAAVICGELPRSEKLPHCNAPSIYLDA